MKNATTRANLISGGTQGLRNDMRIVRDVLIETAAVHIYSSRRRNLHLPLTRLTKLMANKLLGRREVNIFFEIIPSDWHLVSARNVLIPNQEWIREDVQSKISYCAEIWCKSEYAAQIFTERGYPTRYIGFSSRDLYDRTITKDWDKFIHIPGRSDLKGTRTLLRVWRENPTFPRLVVVGSQPWLAEFGTNNIEVVNRFVTETELRHLVNSSGIHLCPSEAEGFGHYISEAMSTGSLVITTDAPPMREYALPERELLVQYSTATPMGWGERFILDPDDLTKKISGLIRMPAREKSSLGALSRQTFLRNSALFRARLLDAFGSLTQSGL